MSDLNASITFSCPSCSAEGYEVDLDQVEISNGTQVSFPCDDCGVTLAVDAEVRLQVLGGAA